jgi:tRNA/tmRNA/rRNA uracil-C5-methylase (TrmA/RlmC/RlmD family)
LSEQPTVVKVTFNAEDFFDALHKANKQLYEMALDAVSTNFAENGNKILNLSEVPEDLRE